MMVVMPESAPLVALAFLTACGAILISFAILGYSLLTRNQRRIAWTAAAIAGGISLYAGLLIGFSLISRTRVLGTEELKYFCELDCHLAYSVREVSTVKTLGDPAHALTANGLFYLVKIRTWFDERTISPRRGNGLLSPNPRRVSIIDADGREYSPSPEGLRTLSLLQQGGTPLTQMLRPGESYETVLPFDLPNNIRNPQLFLTDADWVGHFLIGHELSPLHSKVLFQLTPHRTD